MSSNISRRKSKFSEKEFKAIFKDLNDDFKKLRKIKSYMIANKRPDFCKPINDVDEGAKNIKELFKKIKDQYKIDMKEESKREKNTATGFSAPSYVDFGLCDLMNKYIDDPNLKIVKKTTADKELGVLNRVLAGQFISWYVRKNSLTSPIPKASKTLFKLDEKLMKIFKPHIHYLKDQIKEKVKARGGVSSSKCAKIEKIDGDYWINYSALQIIITPLFQSKYVIPYREKYTDQINTLKQLFAKPKKEPKRKKKTDEQVDNDEEPKKKQDDNVKDEKPKKRKEESDEDEDEKPKKKKSNNKEQVIPNEKVNSDKNTKVEKVIPEKPKKRKEESDSDEDESDEDESDED